MSSLYLSFLNKQPHAQQLTSNTNFMSKHKISVNTPSQAHYTVQGVQLYAPQQIKALKQKQDRLMQGKDGIYAQPQVYLLSNQIMDDDTDAYDQQKFNKNKVKDIKQKPKTAKQVQKRQSKTVTNTRNAVSTNNQAIVKLEKQMAKRNSLQNKLDQMTKKYKQHFKGKDANKNKQKHKQQELQQQKSQQNFSQGNNEQLSESNKQIQQISQYQKLSKTTKNPSTTKQYLEKKSKSKNKNKRKIENENENETENITEDKSQIPTNKKSKKHEEVQQNSQIIQFSQQQESNKSKSNRSLHLNLGYELINKSTTYSQKLGTAIFQMFK